MWMNGTPGTKLMTADGSVPKSGERGIRVFHMHVISGGTAGEVKLYNGKNANGTLMSHNKCSVVSVGNDFSFGAHGLYFPNGCYYKEVVDNDVVSTAIVCYAEEPGDNISLSSSSSSCRSSSSSSCSSSKSSSSSSCRSSSSSSSSVSSSSSSSSCRSSSSSSSSSSKSSSSSSCRSSSSSSCSKSSSSSSANP